MPALFGILVAALSRLFSSQLGRWLAGALLFLGIGLATQSAITGPSLSYIQSLMAGGSGDAVQWMAFLNFDKAITMLFSAYAARATVSAGKIALARRSA